MKLEEIKQFFEDNKEDQEVQDYLKGLQQVTPEGINEFLESDEGKRVIQPKLDSYFTKGLESWKAKNLESIVNDEVAKRTSDKTPEQQQMDDLRKELNAIKNDKKREVLKNHAFKFASENGLPADLIDYFIKLESEDDENATKSLEATNKNLEALKNQWSNHLQKTVNEKLKGSSFNPSIDGGSKTKSFTKEQIDAMSPDEINANWDEVQKVLKSE